MKQLMTKAELQRWIPSLRTANFDIADAAILTVELDLFDTCLGETFRSNLSDDKIDYSSVLPFQDGKTYSVNDLVEHEHIVYKSLASSNTSLLYDKTKWAEAPFFLDEKYNELWKVGMASWISYNIWKSIVAFQTYMVGGKGPVKHYEDSGERTVESPEYYTLIKSIEQNASMAKRVMLAYCARNGFLSSGGSCTDASGNTCNESEENRVAWPN